MMGRCYIVGAGELYGTFDPTEEDLVIAADGGLIHLNSMGIKPDILLGDFDSLYLRDLNSLDEKTKGDTRVKKKAENAEEKSPEDEELLVTDSGIEIMRYPVMKDETDMLLAYRIGAERGYTTFYIYGGVGGREDHTFANYCLLLEAKESGNHAYLIGKSSRAFVIKNEKINIFGKSGKTVSVFPFGCKAEGVSIRGLKYEAENIDMSPSYPIGVSNSYTDAGKGEISVKNGILLIIEEI